MKSVSVLIVLSVISLSHCSSKTTQSGATFLVSFWNDAENTSTHFCTGVLLTAKRILTAASCLEYVTERLTISTAGPANQYYGEDRKLESFVVPEVSKNYSDQLAIVTVNEPFENITLINVDSEELDEDSKMLSKTLPVYQYFYSWSGVVRRNEAPKSFVKNLDLLKKHLYLEYDYVSEEAGCNTTLDPSLGCPIVRDNLVVGIILHKHIVEKGLCPEIVGAIGIRTPIYANWIDDEIRKDLLPKEEKSPVDGEVSAPFLVSIQRYTPTGVAKHFCHGSLIAPNLILTAAICLKNDTDNLVAVAGISSLTDLLGQRRSISLQETSKFTGSKQDLRQEIAVAWVYPPFSKGSEVNSIVVSYEKMCGKLGVFQYLYDPEKINNKIYRLHSKEQLPESQMEIELANPGEGVMLDCSIKLCSSIGAPLIYDDELVGVIITNVDEGNCDLVTKKRAVRTETSMKWIEEQMKEKILEYDQKAKQ